MKRIVFSIAVLALFGLVVVNDTVSAQKDAKKDEKKEAKAHTIKEIMKIAHTDKASLLKVIAADAKDGKWDDASKKSKELVTVSEELAMAKPKKGDDDSWKKVTGEYVETAKKVEAASDKKDADAVKSALGTLGSSCKGCHSAHK